MRLIVARLTNRGLTFVALITGITSDFSIALLAAGHRFVRNFFYFLMKQPALNQAADLAADEHILLIDHLATNPQRSVIRNQALHRLFAAATNEELTQKAGKRFKLVLEERSAANLAFGRFELFRVIPHILHVHSNCVVIF